MRHSCDVWEKFPLCFAGSRLALLVWLHSIRWQSKKHSSQIQALQILTARIMSLQHQGSWCAVPCSSQCRNGSGKEVENTANSVCDLKSCRGKCLRNQGCRMLQSACTVPQRGVMGMIPRMEADSSFWSYWVMGLLWVLVASANSFQRVWFTCSFPASVLLAMWCSSGMGDASRARMYPLLPQGMWSWRVNAFFSLCALLSLSFTNWSGKLGHRQGSTQSSYLTKALFSSRWSRCFPSCSVRSYAVSIPCETGWRSLWCGRWLRKARYLK